MEYEESYYGRRIVVTTEPTEKGAWTSRAELLDDEGRVFSTTEAGRVYASESDARRDALSTAAGIIDRSRAPRGKPSA
jgi:hypothetical protein